MTVWKVQQAARGISDHFGDVGLFTPARCSSSMASLLPPLPVASHSQGRADPPTQMHPGVTLTLAPGPSAAPFQPLSPASRFCLSGFGCGFFSRAIETMLPQLSRTFWVFWSTESTLLVLFLMDFNFSLSFPGIKGETIESVGKCLDHHLNSVSSRHRSAFSSQALCAHSLGAGSPRTCGRTVLRPSPDQGRGLQHRPLAPGSVWGLQC